MYFFGLSKEEVLSQKHVVSYKETSKQTPINMVTLFGRQVYQVKSESSKSDDGYQRLNSPKLLAKDIDLRLPADHYAYTNFHETLGSGKFYGIGGYRDTVEMRLHSGHDANNVKEASTTNWSGKRNPRIVIDLEEPPPTGVSHRETTEHAAASVSYVTVRNPETKPLFFDRISSNILKVVDQSLVEYDSDKTTSKEPSLLDLNSTPVDESVSEPHYCFLQDLNCPYIEEETETSCEKSGIDDGPTPLCSPQCQNVHEKDGTASPASYTSCCTTENNSRTESRRSSSPRALEPSCRTRLEFTNTEDLLEGNGCCNEEEDSSEVIQMAAESLVHISEISYQNQDLQSKLVSRINSSSQDQDFPDKPEMGKAEPGCSCDSYERHTLGIRETNTEEDFCVSSVARDELNNITRDSNKEIGLKLRRGRRMKNFQKEILPSLTSLSRHEIREDINILEAVLRSREYKKLQGKTKDVKFRANPRNKRSAPQRCFGKRKRKSE
ncbi:unnamed protein product [Arabidopsis lyrata]|uniref:Uncharacterized protein n=1 Tax=Arabidopsis lyrata subsp. lyrata TaxID=81972 RepID=D7KN95_ARALL|nr:uncharacterized protein LOC9325980 [Arabidopsis lyrata subsp. lyrata]EFH68935.1 hypothetical protein ARALYDRAFT_471361 [Arabidopsis lyrata subsp. lyrata]CAH8252019.1 unnamed protein product [Arabidopsis lyrata]|eukprot:XP_020868735.1 uncharacterized protein LOC9325980 [Arabidopsis lyrata subsp. lyrata]